MQYKVEKLDVKSFETICKVVDLLRAVFPNDESINIEWFMWKHVDSYYGPSYAWGVYSTDQLVGVRLYAKWRSLDGVNEYVQAVDTATHPLHQRKGVFALLLKHSLSFIDMKGIKIFNFPNQNSMSQYLKYGWESCGEIYWCVGLSTSMLLKSLFVSLKVKPPGVTRENVKGFLVWRVLKKPKNKYEVLDLGGSNVIIKPYVYRDKIKLAQIVCVENIERCSGGFLDCLVSRGYIGVMFLSSERKIKSLLGREGFYVFNDIKRINFVSRPAGLDLDVIGLLDMDFV